MNTFIKMNIFMLTDSRHILNRKVYVKMKKDVSSGVIRERRGIDLTLLAVGSGYAELIGATLTALLNYYYVYTRGLSNGYFAVAQIIYAVYVALIDPVIGYATNRRFKFTSKLGRATPFIIGGGITALLFAILVYLAPGGADQIGLMFWMLFTLSLSSTFFSMFSTNYQALQPVIVREKKQRVGFGTRVVIFGTTCMILGFIIPEFGDITTSTGYLIPMFITAGVGIVLLLVMLPAVREEPALTEELLRKSTDGKFDFFHVIWQVVRMKNFMLYMLVYLAFQVISLTAIASLPYFAQYIMLMPDDKINSTRTMLVLIEFAAVFVSLPLWSALAKKHEFKTIFGLCGIALAAACAPIMILSSYVSIIIGFACIGLAVGGFWSLLPPLFSDIMDEACVKLGGHVAGMSAGVKTIFARLALVLQALIYYLVRTATNFEPSQIAPGSATPAMLFGIRFEMVGVGCVLLVIFSIIFLMKYDLVGDKMKRIKESLNSRVAMQKGVEELRSE